MRTAFSGRSLQGKDRRTASSSRSLRKQKVIGLGVNPDRLLLSFLNWVEIVLIIGGKMRLLLFAVVHNTQLWDGCILWMAFEVKPKAGREIKKEGELIFSSIPPVETRVEGRRKPNETPGLNLKELLTGADRRRYTSAFYPVLFLKRVNCLGCCPVGWLFGKWRETRETETPKLKQEIEITRHQNQNPISQSSTSAK